MVELRYNTVIESLKDLFAKQNVLWNAESFEFYYLMYMHNIYKKKIDQDASPLYINNTKSKLNEIIDELEIQKAKNITISGHGVMINDCFVVPENVSIELFSYYYTSLGLVSNTLDLALYNIDIEPGNYKEITDFIIEKYIMVIIPQKWKEIKMALRKQRLDLIDYSFITPALDDISEIIQFQRRTQLIREIYETQFTFYKYKSRGIFKRNTNPRQREQRSFQPILHETGSICPDILLSRDDHGSRDEFIIKNKGIQEYLGDNEIFKGETTQMVFYFKDIDTPEEKSEFSVNLSYILQQFDLIVLLDSSIQKRKQKIQVVIRLKKNEFLLSELITSILDTLRTEYTMRNKITIRVYTCLVQPSTFNLECIPFYLLTNCFYQFPSDIRVQNPKTSSFRRFHRMDLVNYLLPENAYVKIKTNQKGYNLYKIINQQFFEVFFTTFNLLKWAKYIFNVIHYEIDLSSKKEIIRRDVKSFYQDISYLQHLYECRQKAFLKTLDDYKEIIEYSNLTGIAVKAQGDEFYQKVVLCREKYQVIRQYLVGNMNYLLFQDLPKLMQEIDLEITTNLQWLVNIDLEWYNLIRNRRYDKVMIFLELIYKMKKAHNKEIGNHKDLMKLRKDNLYENVIFPAFGFYEMYLYTHFEKPKLQNKLTYYIEQNFSENLLLQRATNSNTNLYNYMNYTILLPCLIITLSNLKEYKRDRLDKEKLNNFLQQFSQENATWEYTLQEKVVSFLKYILF